MLQSKLNVQRGSLVSNVNVWFREQVCLLLERNAPRVSQSQGPEHSSTFLLSYLVDIHSAEIWVCKSFLLLLLLSLFFLSLTFSWSFLPTQFSWGGGGAGRILSPVSCLYQEARSWRSFWMWSSHFLLIGHHQEEELRIFSYYSDASYSKSPSGIIETNFCFNSILPCTSSPTGC